MRFLPSARGCLPRACRKILQSVVGKKCLLKNNFRNKAEIYILELGVLSRKTRGARKMFFPPLPFLSLVAVSEYARVMETCKKATAGCAYTCV